MAFKQQNQTGKLKPSIPKDYPQFPTIPQEMSERFPVLQGYKESQDLWWTQMRQHFVAIEARITALEK